MLSIFSGYKKKTPKELVTSLKGKLILLYDTKLQQDAKALKAFNEEIAKYLEALHIVLYGENDKENAQAPKKSEIDDVAKESHQCDLITLLTQNLPLLEFESRRYATQIINHLINAEVSVTVNQNSNNSNNSSTPTTSNGTTHNNSSNTTSVPTKTTKEYLAVKYIESHPELMKLLIEYFDIPDLSTRTSSIIHECLKHEKLAKLLLFQITDDFFKLFKFINSSNANIVGDAIATLRDCFQHKNIAAEFLNKFYTRFFCEYMMLLQQSNNYLTKRHSLLYLNELLMERSNLKVMQKFVNEEEHLKGVMNLLLDKSKHIQAEAVILFKLFVTNPNKSEPIKDIILGDRQKLITLITDISTNNENFIQKKKDVLDYLSKMSENEGNLSSDKGKPDEKTSGLMFQPPEQCSSSDPTDSVNSPPSKNTILN